MRSKSLLFPLLVKRISRTKKVKILSDDTKGDTRPDLPRGLDGRTREARSWREVYGEVRKALGDKATPDHERLIRRAATLTVLLERLEGQACNDEALDPISYVRVTREWRVLMDRLGVLPEAVRPKPKPSGLDHYRDWPGGDGTGMN